ncbi:hypothetical protein HYU14_04340 [Candidatus Woesearchaeota archaeon]|nr:hypothetical protein [Candidatus Woesearchaeota archaeon]
MPHKKTDQIGQGKGPNEMSHEHFLATAPMRIDLAGGTTDINFFVEKEKEGGATLNMAITLLSADGRPLLSSARGYQTTEDGIPTEAGIHIVSKDLAEEVWLKAPESYSLNGRLDLLRTVTKRFGLSGNYEIETNTGAPPGSGLGSSGSIAVAFGGLLNMLTGSARSRQETVDLCFKAERNDLGVLCGKQDQSAAAYGGINLFKFIGDTTERYPLGPEIDGRMNIGNRPEWNKKVPSECSEFRKALLEHMVLCYTGKSHYSGNANELMRENYLRGGAAGDALRKIREITLLMEWAFRTEDIGKIIELSRAETENRVRLGEEIGTGKDGDYGRAIQAGLSNGASAAKILGAGAGGSILFYATPENRAALESALKEHFRSSGNSHGRILSFQVNYDGLKHHWPPPLEAGDTRRFP